LTSLVRRTLILAPGPGETGTATRRSKLRGFVNGVIASLLGIAGGEFLIPTLVLLFGLDLKVAGSLSLATSLPTMLAGFARYSRDKSFVALVVNRAFLLTMAVGSVVDALCGGLLLGIVPTAVLLPILVAVLVLSAIKIWRHWKAVSQLDP
jgi:uncharacterized membrane protein YfcA